MAIIRSLGGIIPYITVEENHEDALEITQHPVQQGASISDHAFKLPAKLKIVYGFRDDINATYDKFQKLQNDATLVDVVTGKRSYKNMLIKSLATTTDAKTNEVLFITADLTEVIIVSTQTSSVPPRARQKNAGRTGATDKAGTKQAKTVTDTQKKSALASLAGL